jgi:hypothetical protein
MIDNPDWSPREQTKAEVLLLKMDRREDIAEKVEHFTRSSEPRSDHWQRKFNDLYRESIGVDAWRRDELRSALREIVAGRRVCVADILAAINQSPSNGSASGLAGPPTGGVWFARLGDI